MKCGTYMGRKVLVPTATERTEFIDRFTFNGDDPFVEKDGAYVPRNSDQPILLLNSSNRKHRRLIDKITRGFGNLSHVLNPAGPSGYNPRGEMHGSFFFDSLGAYVREGLKKMDDGKRNICFHAGRLDAGYNPFFDGSYGFIKSAGHSDTRVGFVFHPSLMDKLTTKFPIEDPSGERRPIFESFTGKKYVDWYRKFKGGSVLLPSPKDIAHPEEYGIQTPLLETADPKHIMAIATAVKPYFLKNVEHDHHYYCEELYQKGNELFEKNNIRFYKGYTDDA
jgi:hypothetical protein